jgi:hypothetical protein
MGGGPVGGNPATIQDGGAGLRAAAKDVGSRAAGFSAAGGTGSGGVGNGELAAALSRFAAAYSEVCADLDTQLGGAALLATNASADLRTAGGH